MADDIEQKQQKIYDDAYKSLIDASYINKEDLYPFAKIKELQNIPLFSMILSSSSAVDNYLKAEATAAFASLIRCKEKEEWKRDSRRAAAAARRALLSSSGEDRFQNRADVTKPESIEKDYFSHRETNENNETGRNDNIQKNDFQEINATSKSSLSSNQMHSDDNIIEETNEKVSITVQQNSKIQGKDKLNDFRGNTEQRADTNSMAMLTAKSQPTAPKHKITLPAALAGEISSSDATPLHLTHILHKLLHRFREKTAQQKNTNLCFADDSVIHTRLYQNVSSHNNITVHPVFIPKKYHDILHNNYYLTLSASPFSTRQVVPLQYSDLRHASALFNKEGMTQNTTQKNLSLERAHIHPAMDCQSLLVVQSLAKLQDFSQCKPFEYLKFDFFSTGCISVGSFLTDHCFTKALCPTCSEPITDHERSFFHNGLRVDIRVAPSTAQQCAVLCCYSKCKECGACTILIPASRFLWNFSFGKFLEGLFYGTPAEIELTCKHTDQDYVRYFCYGDQHVSFSITPIRVYAMIQPPLRIKVDDKNKIETFFLNQRADEIAIKIDDVFKRIEKGIHMLVHAIETSEVELSHKTSSLIIEQTNKLKERIEATHIRLLQDHASCKKTDLLELSRIQSAVHDEWAKCYTFFSLMLSRPKISYYLFIYCIYFYFISFVYYIKK